MYKRESILRNFITTESNNVYLSSKTQNVRIAVIHEREINFGSIGSKCLIQKGDKIILMYKHRDNLLVSVLRYEDEAIFTEEASRISKVDETNPTFPRLRDVYPNMENPATICTDEMYM